MKTKITLSAITITALLFVSSFSYGQGCHGGGGNSCHNKSDDPASSHANRSQYGGTVRQVGKYTIEMVYTPLMAQDPITFYLMKKKEKPVSNQGITGKAEIIYADGRTGTITLEPRGENGFAGQMINKTSSFICLLTLTVNCENLTVRFDGEGTAATQNTAAKATYTCPMHPEVQFDKPGDCPKCGMSLVKQ